MGNKGSKRQHFASKLTEVKSGQVISIKVTESLWPGMKVAII